MGVTLERVQNKFACIIGELCSEPDILSEFAIWLDLRLAEYKAKGAISLECSGESPDPTWLRGYKGPPKRMKQGDMTPTLPTERLHHYDSISQYEQDLSQEAAERLSPEIMVVKEEPSDNSGVYPVSVHRHTTPNRNHSRKRSEPGAAGQSGDSPSPFKIQRLSEPATVLEPVNQSLMSIISESGLDDSGDVADMSSADFSNIDISTNRGDNSNVFSTQVIPSTSSRDSAEQQDGSNSGDPDSGPPDAVVLPHWQKPDVSEPVVPPDAVPGWPRSGVSGPIRSPDAVPRRERPDVSGPIRPPDAVPRWYRPIESRPVVPADTVPHQQRPADSAFLGSEDATSYQQQPDDLKHLFTQSYPARLSVDMIRHRLKPDREALGAAAERKMLLVMAQFERWAFSKYREIRCSEAMPPADLDAYLAEFFTVTRRRNGKEFDAYTLVERRGYIIQFLKATGCAHDLADGKNFPKSMKAFQTRHNYLIHGHVASEDQQ